MGLESYFGSFTIVKIIFERGLSAIYLIAFISALNQFRPLLGERGLLPVPEFLKYARFWDYPSIFHFKYSDKFFVFIAWLGIIFSAIILLGLLSNVSWVLYMFIWLVLWALYMSIVNVGQTFYAFGWESMLLEAGFFAAFLGSVQFAPGVIPILALRWMLFRTEVGAGLIKLRSDLCWRNLSCLFYHYETQPLPNPLSWYFHHFPKFFHKLSVLFSHIVQVIVPFGLFGPAPVAAISGALIIFHQLWLIISGNYSWLNWITIVLGVTAMSDAIFGSNFHFLTAPVPFQIVLFALASLTIMLSLKPLLNLFSKNQLMNYNYNPYHLVGAYGAFGTITKERYEIVIEGTDEGKVTSKTKWQEYEFKGKPGRLKRIPPQVAPYHLRLDWLMWFLPFSVIVERDGVIVPGHELWFLRMIQKLLKGDKELLSFLGKNPFTENSPRFIRARFYRYQFTNREEKKETGAIWKRTPLGEYLQPMSLVALDKLDLYQYQVMPADSEKPVMLYDGDCGFCQKWIDKWQKAAKGLVKFAPYQKEGKNYPQVLVKDCQEAVQLIDPDGCVYSGAHAVFKALAFTSQSKFTLHLYEKSSFFRFITEKLYQWVAHHRSFLSKITRQSKKCVR